MFLIARLSLISTLISLSSALVHNVKLGAVQLENVQRGESSLVKTLKTCELHPLGLGKDDTDQVQAAISKCGHFGTINFASGSYNITRKMTWDLVSSTVNLNGYLNFPPNIDFWLNANNTYRVVFIQSQASWFVVTGSDFVIDAHNTGGIQGNGQPWWSYFTTHTREDGDGRPISLTLYKVARGTIKNFRIESPPFWSNAVAESTDVVYDGMFVNATNTDPLYLGKNVVPNTDGIDTYRSDRVSLLNWDVTCGDDCIAIKGNSTNLDIRNITCRGGNGVAIGSLGQYVDMVSSMLFINASGSWLRLRHRVKPDNVINVEMDNLQMIRLDPNVQPNMGSGVYFKSWDGSVNGSPPTGGGGAKGTVNNVVVRNMKLDRVTAPVHVYQTNNAKSGDLPSQLRFGGLHFINWTGTAVTNKVVDIECSPAANCSNISFENFNVSPPAGQGLRLICQNTIDVTGLSALCNSTGQA
ncbi:pectin lyase-like protein [Pholiota conissans]|uniref:galacturonan 1,4-alpha-galacturonidase n=1 Tax=Pholiota conissans TaxID=109636 RepID=A0A9P5ZEN7_9AGAR|nr:pectin lyase-like protein [Pholiota conissans]